MNGQRETNSLELAAARFQRDGYFLVKGLIAPERCGEIRNWVANALSPLQGPAEYEADVGYDGSPGTREAYGGNTPRRLLNVFSRDQLFRDLALDKGVSEYLQAFIRRQKILVSQCHHNCVMTKHPGFSSSTMWHQDIRYWSFDRPELVSAWFALGNEQQVNGGLLLIPESHELNLDRGRFDRNLFVRDDLMDNQTLIEKSLSVDLNAGDVLFFHCRTIHAAGRNETDSTKVSVVFTYHDQDNQPIPGSRSAQYPSIGLPG